MCFDRCRFFTKRQVVTQTDEVEENGFGRTVCSSVFVPLHSLARLGNTHTPHIYMHCPDSYTAKNIIDEIKVCQKKG